MQSENLLERARRLAGMSRAELARSAKASRPTLAAYAAGTKSPTLATAQRVVEAAGFTLDLTPRVSFREAGAERSRAAYVPTTLPRLAPDRAFARVRLPLHLNWSQPGQEFILADRRHRARVYEIVLREGTAEDILTYVDGALLVDLWPDLVIPAALRRVWQPLVDNVVGSAAG